MIAPRKVRRRTAALVFLTLLGSSAYFWQARDWNISSRLMLTYALADRGTVRIDGLEDHTRDRARVGRHYYTDKLPGFSLIALAPYLTVKPILGLPDHPLDRAGVGFTHWFSDYVITVFTSGLATAITGVLLVLLAFDLGCGPRRAGLVGLGYGLTTPAFVYSTLGYGHQLTAAALLGSFVLLWHGSPGRLAAASAGFLAALAVTVELQVAPAAAILGVYLVILVIGRRTGASRLAWFAFGALMPIIVLLTYNTIAFGSPLDMGYFHEDIAQFRDVHNKANPLGLRGPDRDKIVPLLWGRFRGLFFYAPITILAFPGWLVMAWKRLWGMLGVTLGVCLAVFLVNLSYPEWTGGWSTGPRLLLPLLPFALLPVAALLDVGGKGATIPAVLLALAGGVLMLLFQGAGGRMPQDVADPLMEIVRPVWSNGALGSMSFARNLGGLAMPEAVAALPPNCRWLQFAPLLVFQGLMLGVLLLVTRPRVDEPITPRTD